jgi:hypothetical protein
MQNSMAQAVTGGMPLGQLPMDSLGGMGGMPGLPAGLQHGQQQGAEAAALRYPEPLPTHSQLMPAQAADLLVSAIGVSASKPYQWGYIDRPQGAHVPNV